MQVQSVSVSSQTNLSRQDRDDIVLEHLPLAKAIAIRVHESLPVHVDLDDLVHAGVLGLFDAVEKYDDSKNVEFRSYAKHRIKGAILDPSLPYPTGYLTVRGDGGLNAVLNPHL